MQVSFTTGRSNSNALVVVYSLASGYGRGKKRQTSFYCNRIKHSVEKGIWEQ